MEIYEIKRADRCVALDALRGVVMIALAWGLLAREGLLQAPALRWLGIQLHHVEWQGMTFWDLIQPGFWLAVGAAMPFALARRVQRGFTFRQNLRHALGRAIKLAVFGQILISIEVGHPIFHPRETLTQIAVCYLICFLIVQLKFRWQVFAAASLMILNWGVYALFPGSTGPYSPQDNIGVLIDRAIFGMNSAGKWVTIYFIGSSVTMLIGCWTGALLMGDRPPLQKLRVLVLAVVGCFAAGLALVPFNPLMQKTWTPSYTFCATGIVLLATLALYWTLDLKGYLGWAFPLIVVGMNGIFFYLLSQALSGWTDKSLAVFTNGFHWIGPAAPAVQAGAVIAVMWYVCYWLYERKIFFKL